MFPALKTLFALSSLVLVAQDPGLDALREEGRWKQLRPRIEGWYRAKPEDPYALLWMSRLKQTFGDPEAALFAGDHHRHAFAPTGDEPVERKGDRAA